MIVGVLSGPTELDLIKQMEEASLSCDLLEARIDLWEDARFLKVLSKGAKAWILTLRPQRQMGECSQEESSRLQQIKELARLYAPNWIDLEYDVDQAWVKSILDISPKAKLIRSLHCKAFDLSSAKDLFSVDADLYKWAMPLSSSMDFIDMLSRANQQTICVGMGKPYSFARILSLFKGAKWSYVHLGGVSCAPGQLSASQMNNLYGHIQSKGMAIYALIGDPLDKSPGIFFHNQYFQDHGKHACYLNIPLKEQELRSFFSWLHQNPWIEGLSITSPLKEASLPFFDQLSPRASYARSVNTLYRQGKNLCGDCTDGVGGGQLFPQGPKQKIAILGAGGTARALALEAVEQGHEVVLCNRTPEKNQAFAESLGISWQGLTSLPIVDGLINATSSRDPLASLPLVSWVMEANHGQTLFLEKATSQGMRALSGADLFKRQAHLQQAIWEQKQALDAERVY